MIPLLIDMLNTDTQNPPGNERILADYIRDRLAGTACETTIQDLGGNRANVIARVRGRERGGALMLNGHLDTVPNGDGWTSHPQRAEARDGRLYARGASDMKSGLAAMLCAFRALAASGKAPRHDVLFAATCDEEAGGAGAKALAEAGWLSGVETVLIGEPTGLGLGLAAKGCLWLGLRARGRTSHGAYPGRGVNAIDGLYGFCRVVQGAMAGGEHPLLGPATAALTRMEGGIKANMVPDQARAVMDLRTLPGTDHVALVNRLQALCGEYCAQMPGLQIDIAVENDRMPVETRPDCPHARALERLHRQLYGRPMPHTGTAFFSDASIFLRYADCHVVQFGPGESALAHTPNESVSVADCEKALALLRALLEEA